MTRAQWHQSHGGLGGRSWKTGFVFRVFGVSFRFDNLLLSGDNIFRDGCVGGIDAHHGSDIPDFIESLKRIQASDIEWLLPSHGPAFRNEHALLQSTINRLDGYQHMADFGTCAVDWPLMDEWDDELARGTAPTDN